MSNTGTPQVDVKLASVTEKWLVPDDLIPIGQSIFDESLAGPVPRARVVQLIT